MAVHSLAATKGAVSIQEHLSEGQYGVLWKQFIKHQLAISESPAHWPTATQVSPDMVLGDGLWEGEGDGEGQSVRVQAEKLFGGPSRKFLVGKQ